MSVIPSPKETTFPLQLRHPATIFDKKEDTEKKEKQKEKKQRNRKYYMTSVLETYKYPRIEKVTKIVYLFAI